MSWALRISPILLVFKPQLGVCSSSLHSPVFQKEGQHSSEIKFEEENQAGVQSCPGALGGGLQVEE